MRLLATGDTHVPDWYPSLPRKLIDEAKRSDLIVLTGNIVGSEVIETLRTYAPVEGVQGNFCHVDLKQSLPTKKTLELNGWKIGLTHGHLGHGTSADEKSLHQFTEGKVGLVVHGHTHHHHVATIDGVHIVDPGSPLDTRFTRRNSYAIITLGDEIGTQFVILDTR